MTPSTKPVTRESSAFIRDKGVRPLIVTIVGSVLELRGKGLRSREVIDLASCWSLAVKQRIASERAAKKAGRLAKHKKGTN